MKIKKIAIIFFFSLIEIDNTDRALLLGRYLGARERDSPKIETRGG